jgi:hypothetical protein
VREQSKPRRGRTYKLGDFYKASRQRQERGHKSKRGANPKEGTNPKGTPKPSSSGVGYCIRFLCVISLLLYLLEISIIKFLFYWFSPWGFFQGHVDQKYMCKNLVVCLFPYQHLVEKIYRSILCFNAC